MKSSENKQLDTADLEALLVGLLVIAAVLALDAILRFYRGRGILAGDPLAFYIVSSFIVAYLLYKWKNKFDFVKRCILAAPFVPLFAIVLRIAGFETVRSINLGIVIFLFLVMRTDNWKRHFLITLMTAVIFTVLLAYYQLRRGDLNVYEILAIPGLGCPFAVFYTAYLAALVSQKTIRLRHIALQSIVGSGPLLLVFTSLLIPVFSFERNRLGFWISIIISVLLSLCLLGFCYRFRISLSDSSVSNKNDEKTNKAGKCALCGRSIYSSEVSHTIKDHTFCVQCYKKIEQEKARITG